ncbi:protein kinase-like domain [Purpureocillium lavendulum]|uniref:Protein kinase-like domain n=1 Tax=Purpureocillium lavendulum TaxID=1247861 RepID=A0AB34FFL9_9HYPO|nr:protein kinase-like domain [Purpureocillium lavendulum]
MLDGQMLAAGDAELQTLLKRIRQGVQDQTDLDLLNSRCYREGRRIPWESGITVVTPLNRNRWNLNMEATLAFQMQQRSTMRIFISEHKWKQGQPTEEEAVMMLNQGDDSAIPVPAVFMAVEVIVDKSHPGYQISAGITIHFGPPAGVILESGTTEEFHFVGMPPGTILLTPMSVSIPCQRKRPWQQNDVSRKGLPCAAAFACTDYKVQGGTFDRVALELRGTRTTSTDGRAIPSQCDPYSFYRSKRPNDDVKQQSGNSTESESNAKQQSVSSAESESNAKQQSDNAKQQSDNAKRPSNRRSQRLSANTFTRAMNSSSRSFRSNKIPGCKHACGAMGDMVGSRRIADEKGLELFLHIAVEEPVRKIVGQLVQNPVAREALDLGDGIVFENHPHALSDASEEVVDREARPVPPSTPGHGENLKKLQADQICICRSDGAQGSRTRAFICEYKPPHKLTVQHLHVGLRIRDIYNEVVNRKTMPTPEDTEARFEYHAERLTASAITQTYHYMIEAGLEYSLLTTGEAIVFLKVDWREPGTLFYHMAVPSIEVAAQTRDARLCTAVAQYLAFTLLAIDGLGTRWHNQDERDRATKRLNRWEASFESTYQSIPEEDRSFLPDSSPGYQPPTYGNVDRSPVRRRKNPPRGQGHADARVPSRRDDRSESSDEEPNPRTPATPTPAQRNTRQGARRSERLAMRPREGGADNSGQRRPFCTQKCLLGLVRGHAMDHSCPNISRHCQGKTHSGRGAIRHPIDHAKWLQLLRAQLKETLDRGITPLEKGGARGVLFKVTLLEYGYTFVSKGTIKAFIPDLEHEAAVYRRLEDIQGIHVPVFLGAVDLRSLHRTYYYDHRVYIVHLTLMSWGGESLHEGRGRMPTTEEQVKRGLHALHQHGVIHKDVRAPNILFCEETGGAMMIDFERAELLEPPRPPLAKMTPNKRPLTDEVGKRKRRKQRHTGQCLREDILMASRLFVTGKEVG